MLSYQKTGGMKERDLGEEGGKEFSYMYSAAQRHANIETRSERNVNSFNSRGERVSFQVRIQRNAFTGNGERVRWN